MVSLCCCCVLQGIQPEVRTYNTIITACNKSGKPEQGLKVYERMVAKGVKASATTYTALISAYGKQGMVEKAMDIFAGAGAAACACCMLRVTGQQWS
jgi:pentatricopeptide repeat domain-containing protein 1